MAVSAYAASGALSFSAFRTTVVGTSESVSMSKLVARNAINSTTTTDIQYVGTNVPWNKTGVTGTNTSIPTRTTGTPTPAISVSDLHGAIPWFWTVRTNAWGWDYRAVQTGEGDNQVETHENKLYWDNAVVFQNDGQGSQATSITTGGFTYYRGVWTGVARNFFGVYRIGREIDS
jgi:hypothetical protein